MQIFFLPKLHKADTMFMLRRSLISLRNQIAQFQKQNLDLTSEALPNIPDTPSGPARNIRCFMTAESGLWYNDYLREELDFAAGFGVTLPLIESSVFPLNAPGSNWALFVRPRIGIGSRTTMFDEYFILLECMIDFRLFTGFHLFAGPSLRSIAFGTVAPQPWSATCLSYGIQIDIYEGLFMQFRQEPSISSLKGTPYAFYLSTLMLGMSFWL